MGDKRNSYRILLGKPEGKRPLGRPKRRSEDNIKIAADPPSKESYRVSIRFTVSKLNMNPST
jgi:hypothetical protein